MRQQHGPLWSGICWFSTETSWGEHTVPGPKCRNQKRPMRSPIQPRQEPPPRLIQTIDGRNLASPHISSRAKLLTGRCIRVSKTSNQFHPQPGHGQIKSAGNVAALAREENFNLAQYEISLTVKRKSWMYLFLAFFSFCQGWKQRRRHPESAPGIERCICVCVCLLALKNDQTLLYSKEKCLHSTSHGRYIPIYSCGINPIACLLFWSPQSPAIPAPAKTWAAEVGQGANRTYADEHLHWEEQGVSGSTAAGSILDISEEISGFNWFNMV